MNARTKNLLIALGVVVLVIGLGTLSDWYSTQTWDADGIAYFDNATAIRHGDWTTALNPYWSIGYPLVLAVTRWMFPGGWAGDWLSIRVVNLAIFSTTYLSFFYFLQQALAYATKVGGAEKQPVESRGLIVVGSLIFAQWQVQTKQISQMTPDLMVSGLFFLLLAFSLRFCLRPTMQGALLMGIAAGAGYLTKAAFLPVAMFVFLVVAVRISTQSGTDRFSALRKLAWAAPALALLAAPYVIALSTVQGRFTLGESGSLNYAWTVNNLTHWHWTGGPAAFGKPLHGVRLLSASPHVYEYAEPMHVTYPPLYNPYYWYEGYHHFFSLGNQLAAIKKNLFTLSTIFFNTPHAPIKFWGTIALLIASTFLVTKWLTFWKRLLALWPIIIPSLLGTTMYLMVVLEARYIIGFLIVLFVTALIALFVPSPVVSKRTGFLVLIFISLISLTNMVRDTRPALARALRNEPYTNNEEWRIGLFFIKSGVTPGTKVAMVKVERGVQTNWAFISGLRVMGQIGNQDLPENQQIQDFQLFMDTPDVQQNVFDLFRKSGAELVMVLYTSEPPKGEGWSPIPKTTAWMHRL